MMAIQTTKGVTAATHSVTHLLKSAILKFRMSRSEVRSRFAAPEGLEDGLEDGLKTVLKTVEEGP